MDSNLFKLARFLAIRRIIAWELEGLLNFSRLVFQRVIQERTGHLSLSGLHHYERTTDEQHRSVSQILPSSVNATFDREVSMATMPTTVSHSRLPLQPIASMQSFRPVSQASFTPNMNFSGCSVMIYQGTNTVFKGCLSHGKVWKCRFNHNSFNNRGYLV